MSQITFSCVSLAQRGIQGILGKTKEGNYEIVVGGLDVFNTRNEIYEYEPAKHFFESNSPFMRRVQRAALRGEYGHPSPYALPEGKMTDPSQRQLTEDQYFQRLLRIEEKFTCCIHKKITLDFNRVKDKNGKPVIAIISELAPSGPFGPALERSLKEAGENVCFSVRSFTKDRYDGRVWRRAIVNLITFDYVNEPGIPFAEKFMSPAVEGLEDNPDGALEYVNLQMNEQRIKRALGPGSATGIGLESAGLTPVELFKSFGWSVPKSDMPAFMRWGAGQ